MKSQKDFYDVIDVTKSYSSQHNSKKSRGIFLLLTGCLVGVFGQCFKDVDRIPAKQKLTFGMEHFFAASNQFSLRLLQALNTTRDTFFSPFSVWSSLVLVYLGSKGTTEKELEGVLSLHGMDKNIVAHSYQSLKSWFSSRIKTSSFAMRNNIFLQKDIKIHSCLLPFIKDDLAYTDFQENPELARIAINFLIQRQTKDKIKEILPPNSIHMFTQFIVTSTMYFKGSWLQPFLPQSTRPGLFFTSHFEYLLVDMMVSHDTFPYAVSDELQCTAIEMPYAGKSLTMVVMLPKNKAHGVQILISSLTLTRLNNMMEDMFPREIVLALPKFQMEDSFQLSPTLLKLGLRDLVTGAVNLTGFTKDKMLEISAVYHKARITVDEQGTEASAATATAYPRRSHATKILDFIVDRPFVFFIRENHSHSILFIGVVRHPRVLNSIGFHYYTEHL
ncbi:leukocyte elastase inhibitor [Trichonephila inaurata madagascariensis]|uniref:Leukocyte elastase inhibitor n=1 Tax=Trichonephila inaurata madagascariensis TaxID=2747483 RepID=A0A8X6XFF4_9ARAC|nr:leukocyte elastase inhibitor [Trichonephila inaurata madagascariensis]